MPTPRCSSFSEAFQANMTALHMPVPTTLFATLQTAVASVSTMMGALKTLGPDAKVAELFGATTKLEVATVVGAILGSVYLGAVIGSLMVATDAASANGEPTCPWRLRNGARAIALRFIH